MWRRLRVPTQGPVEAVVASALLLAVLAGWLLAAPPGASPDDSYHLGSIWCAEGHSGDVCLPAIGIENPDVALVPAAVIDLTCFAEDGAASAACQAEPRPRAEQQYVASVTNIERRRPNLYYLVMHQFIGDGQDVRAAAGRIRVVNILVTSAMFALTALVAHRRLRAAFILSWIVAALPLGLFFATTVSTSAWSIAGLSTVWANAITARDHPRTANRFGAALLALLGVVMGLGARTEAIAHVAILATSLIATWTLARHDIQRGNGPLRNRDRIATWVASTAGALFFLWLLNAVAPESAGLDSAVGGFRAGYERLLARDIGDPLLAILFEVPTLWTGAFGDAWGLGVLDTPVPHGASIPITAAYVALIAVGTHHGSRARTLGVGLFAAGFIAMPALSLLRSGLLVYESLQPRQFVALAFPVLGLALYRFRAEPELVIGRGMRRTLLGALAFGHSIALAVTMQRHTTGLLPGFDQLPRHIEFGREVKWWWADMPSPAVVWALASLAYLVLLYLALRDFRGDRGNPPSAPRSGLESDKKNLSSTAG